MSTNQENPDREAVPEELRPLIAPYDLKDVIQQIEELVLYTLECEKKDIKDDISFVDVYKQLIMIKQAVDLLAKENAAVVEVMNEAGIVAEGSEIPEMDKKLFGKLSSLKEKCELAKERLHQSLQDNPEEVKRLSEEIRNVDASEKQKARRRKGKFKGVGGMEGWRPA